jgi:hypothetical protein
MIEAMESISAILDQSFKQLATNEFPNTKVLQITPTNQIYVSLANKTDLEVNLIESEKKKLLVAHAIDEEAQKEAVHDSRANSCLIGFKEVYHNYKEQQIPIRTAGNTIYALGIGSIGLLQKP